MNNEDCRMSNFEFLDKDVLTKQYYERAIEAETSYAMGLYSNVLVSARTIAENIAKEVADSNYLVVDERETFDNVLKRLKLGNYIDKYALQFFYDVKNVGNLAAHTLANSSQEEALTALKRLFSLCVWFVDSYYDEKVDGTNFQEPKTEEVLYQTTVQPLSNAEKT